MPMVLAPAQPVRGRYASRNQSERRFSRARSLITKSSAAVGRASIVLWYCFATYLEVLDASAAMSLKLSYEASHVYRDRTRRSAGFRIVHHFCPPNNKNVARCGTPYEAFSIDGCPGQLLAKLPQAACSDRIGCARPHAVQLRAVVSGQSARDVTINAVNATHAIELRTGCTPYAGCGTLLQNRHPGNNCTMVSTIPWYLLVVQWSLDWTRPMRMSV